MNQDIMLTEEALTKRFLFQPNHLNPNAPFDFGRGGAMFETYGEEYAYVVAQPPSCIWTLVDCAGNFCIISGWHFVNRIGYFISELPIEEHMSFCVNLEFEMIEDGGRS